LNWRQEQFCELIVAGKSGTDAWLEAGYKVSREVARTNAAESLANPRIEARIAELRAPVTKKLLLTRERKREILREIAEDVTSPKVDRLRALAEDNRMEGHYEPEKLEIDAGPNTLEAIQQRAKRMASALSLAPQASQQTPASID
jgi:phage terminase small subunit